MPYHLLTIEKKIIRDYFIKDIPTRLGVQNMYYGLHINKLKSSFSLKYDDTYYNDIAFIKYTLHGNGAIKEYGFSIVTRADINNLNLKSFVWGNSQENYLHNGNRKLHKIICQHHYSANIAALRSSFPNEGIDTHHIDNTFDNRSNNLQPLTDSQHGAIQHNHMPVYSVVNMATLQALINAL